MVVTSEQKKEIRRLVLLKKFTGPQIAKQVGVNMMAVNKVKSELKLVPYIHQIRSQEAKIERLLIENRGLEARYRQEIEDIEEKYKSIEKNQADCQRRIKNLRLSYAGTIKNHQKEIESITEQYEKDSRAYADSAYKKGKAVGFKKGKQVGYEEGKTELESQCRRDAYKRVREEHDMNRPLVKIASFLSRIFRYF